MEGINSGQIVKAPWTDEQVEMIRYHQSSGLYHGYTCGGEHEEYQLLSVTPEGFVCPLSCGYIQKWCHQFTVLPVDRPETVYWQGITRDVNYYE